MQNPSNNAIWLRSPRAIFTANELDASNGLVIQDDKIIELVGTGQQPRTICQTSLDCSNWVLTPGLINTHHHFYQTLTRCLPAALNKPLFPWLKTLYKVWQHLDEDMLSIATRLAGLELMLSGASTIADHHYVFPKGLEHAIDVQVETIKSLGCRALLTRGSMSLGESQGGLPPDAVIQPEQAILDDSLRVINNYHDANEGAMLQIALAPCSPFSVSKALMLESAKLAKSQQVLLHTHLAETEDENNFCLREYGMRPLDYLESCNWLGSTTWLAHGIHFTQDEIQRLGDASVGIAHCPSSNGLLASGICPTLELQEAGCPVGLAVDGSASNDCSNMIQETRQSLLQQRLKYGAEKVTAQTVLGFATKGSAHLMHRGDLGQFRVGAQADIACFSLDALRFSGVGDPLAALVLCGAHRVERLMIAGNWSIEDGTHWKELSHEVIALHQQAAASLAQKT